MRGLNICFHWDHFIIWPSSVTLTFNLSKQMIQMALLLLKENTCAKLFWNPCINVEVIAQTSSIYFYFTIWPLNLPKQMFQMALLLLKENTCAKLFWNPCINVEVLAQTSSIYDCFIIWPLSMTLTFNLPKQMFQMAPLLLKENICAKLLRNPCINVEVMAQTTSIYDHYFQPTPTNVSNGTTTPQGEHLCKIILKSMHKCRSYGPDNLHLWPFYHLTFKCDLDLQPTETNVSNGTTTP